MVIINLKLADSADILGFRDQYSKVNPTFKRESACRPGALIPQVSMAEGAV
jgi:hypothetical protein